MVLKLLNLILIPFFTCRSLLGMKSFPNDGVDLEGGKVEKHTDKSIRGNRTIRIHNQALLSGIAYCVSSCSMILVNKFVLSGYDFNAGISLMLYQVKLLTANHFYMNTKTTVPW